MDSLEVVRTSENRSRREASPVGRDTAGEVVVLQLARREKIVLEVVLVEVVAAAWAAFALPTPLSSHCLMMAAAQAVASDLKILHRYLELAKQIARGR